MDKQLNIKQYKSKESNHHDRKRVCVSVKYDRKKDPLCVFDL